MRIQRLTIARLRPKLHYKIQRYLLKQIANRDALEIKQLGNNFNRGAFNVPEIKSMVTTYKNVIRCQFYDSISLIRN